MKRRHFLTTNALAVAALPAVVLESCKGPNGEEGNTELSGKTSDPFELKEARIADLQQQMASGNTTSETITQIYLDRIAAIDQSGINLQAVIELNPDAMTIAKTLDAEREQGQVRGPLHGIPVLIKDNIDTADRMMTTAGSLAMKDHHARRDAFIVERLREAGAVILGKTNLSEWANFRSSRSSSGWSSRGGQTKNPYILDRSPCGSSSGSAVAVAANLCVVAIGTETDGSIACPASMNSIVGIKPTVGLVSRSGIIPISKTQDTAGPFGRTVEDAAILLSVISGADPRDTATTGSPAPVNYLDSLDPNGLKNKRIGVERSFLKKHEAIDTLLHDALEVMRQQGATIVEVEYMKLYDEVSAAEYAVLLYEFKDGLNRYLSAADAPVRSLEALIQYNNAHAGTVMPWFRQEILEAAQALGDLDSPEYLSAIKQCSDMRKKLLDLVAAQQLDALCGPATGLSWCIDAVNGDHWTGYGSYGPAAVGGLPSITLPMGQVNELPVGLSLLGKAYDERGLIAMAFAYEQATQHRQAPDFKPSLGR